MPFEDDYEDLNPPKKGVKSQGKSIFDNKPKKPSQEEFLSAATKDNEKLEGYDAIARDLTVQFKKAIEDKTLPQNKNVFAVEVENELITKMINLAIQINQDPNVIEGMGSVGWLAMILKNLLNNRDKINLLEYSNQILEKKIKERDDKIDEILLKLDSK